MKLLAKVTHPEGPFKISINSLCKNGAQSDHIVAIPQKDIKKFMRDIAALLQSKLVGIQDKIIGAVFFEDRVLYCGKRLEWIKQLDCLCTIPFAIELVRVNSEKVHLNHLPVSEVRKISGATIYGLPYGDVSLDYHFPDVD